jgi:hypothetical protein
MTDYLSPEEKRQLLESRIRTWSLDAYGHELNKAAAGDDPDAIAAADAAIATIQLAITVYEAELAALPVIDSVIDFPATPEFSPDPLS